MKLLALTLLFGLTFGARSHAVRTSSRNNSYRSRYSPKPRTRCPPVESESESSEECSAEESEEHCYVRAKCPPKTCCEEQKNKLEKIKKKLECLQKDLKPAVVNIKSTCLEGGECPTCNQLPGTHFDFACIT